MKAKIKKGEELLFTKGESNKWGSLTDTLIVNLIHKWTYKNFRQKDNHLFITTENGEIDMVFTGEVPKVTLSTYEKDQLVFNLKL